MPNHTPEEGWEPEFDERPWNERLADMTSLADSDPAELKRIIGFISMLLKEQLEEVARKINNMKAVDLSVETQAENETLDTVLSLIR